MGKATPKYPTEGMGCARVHGSVTGAAQEHGEKRGVPSLAGWTRSICTQKRDVLSWDIYSLNCIYPASPLHPGE